MSQSSKLRQTPKWRRYTLGIETSQHIAFITEFNTIIPQLKTETWTFGTQNLPMQLGPVLSYWEDTECEGWHKPYHHAEDQCSTRMPAQPTALHTAAPGLCTPLWGSMMCLVGPIPSNNEKANYRKVIRSSFP